MEHDRARLVVKNADCLWRLAATVVGPPDIPGEHILGPLQPFKTNYRDGTCLGIPRRDCRVRRRHDSPATCWNLLLLEFLPIRIVLDSGDERSMHAPDRPMSR